MNHHKDALVWVLMAFALLLVGAAAYYIITPQLRPSTTLHIGDGVYTAQVASTPSAQDALISSATSLNEDQANILVYSSNGLWSIPASKLQNSVDLVWLNSHKSVVYIVKNASSALTSSDTFTSRENARYILELPAGATTNKSITIGSTASFDEASTQGGM